MTPERQTYFALGFETNEEAAAAEALLRQHKLGPSTIPFEVTLTKSGEIVEGPDADRIDS